MPLTHQVEVYTCIGTQLYREQVLNSTRFYTWDSLDVEVRTHIYIGRFDRVTVSIHKTIKKTDLAVEVATHGLLGPGLVVVVGPPLLLGVTHDVGHCL